MIVFTEVTVIETELLAECVLDSVPEVTGLPLKEFIGVTEAAEVSEFLMEFVSVIDGLPELVVEDVIECVRGALGLIVTEGLPVAVLLGQVVNEELGLTVTVKLGDPVTDWV